MERKVSNRLSTKLLASASAALWRWRLHEGLPVDVFGRHAGLSICWLFLPYRSLLLLPELKQPFLTVSHGIGIAITPLQMSDGKRAEKVSIQLRLESNWCLCGWSCHRRRAVEALFAVMYSRQLVKVTSRKSRLAVKPCPDHSEIAFVSPQRSCLQTLGGLWTA